MEQSKSNKTSKNLKKGVKLIIIITIVVVVLLAIFFGYKYLKTDKLSYYEEKMIEYGLAEKYNNGTPNDEDTVTKSEAVKMIIEAILNGAEIDDYVDVDRTFYYDNFIWVYYANLCDLFDFNYITNDNESESAYLIDTITCLYKSKNKVFIPKDDIEKVVDDKYITIKHVDEYSQEEIDAIEDLISYGILPNKFNYKKDQILTKKIFNEILVKFVEKYQMY